MEKSNTSTIFKKPNKDARWQVVLGYKNKKYRALDALRKLEKVHKKNSNDVNDPIQYSHRNLLIQEEIQRLSDVITFYNAEMKKIVVKIHGDKHI